MNFDRIAGLASNTPQVTNSNSPTPSESIKQFGSYLNEALSSVAAQENNVTKMNENFQLGKVSVDQVMIASEQAMLSLQLTTNVRNKVVEAYQEIMRIQM